MAIDLVLYVEDDAGNVSTTALPFSASFSLPQLIEGGQAFAVLIDAVINGRFRGADLCVNVPIGGLTDNTTTGGSDVEEVAAFEFVTINGNRVKLNVPGMTDLDTLPGSNDLDTTEADVAAVIAMMEDGLAVTSGTIEPQDIGDEDIVDTIFAREHFRSSGRRRR